MNNPNAIISSLTFTRSLSCSLAFTRKFLCRFFNLSLKSGDFRYILIITPFYSKFNNSNCILIYYLHCFSFIKNKIKSVDNFIFYYLTFTSAKSADFFNKFLIHYTKLVVRLKLAFLQFKSALIVRLNFQGFLLI